MNPQKFAACLADLHEWAGRLRRTERLIVYGSVARDTAAEESDLDVLIVCRRDRHEALAHELFLLGARYDVTVSPFLVEPAELAGMALALALAGLLLRMPIERAASILAAALVVLIAIQGLSPFDFQIAQDRFALVPFGESLTRYRATNLTDMFLRCYGSGALVWLLARSGLTVIAATALGAGIIFSIELLQTWLPGQTADITDPLLAIAAGGLIAVFERDAGSR